FDERAFIAQLEAAEANQFADMLSRPSMAEEKALRFHLGDKRYRRLRNMALRRNLRQNERSLGSVIVIHDMFGSSLGAVNGDGENEIFWVNAAGIVGDDFARLRLADDGRTPFGLRNGGQHSRDDSRKAFGSRHDITTIGMLKRHYGELLLSLSQRWDVLSFV